MIEIKWLAGFTEAISFCLCCLKVPYKNFDPLTSGCSVGL